MVVALSGSTAPDWISLGESCGATTSSPSTPTTCVPTSTASRRRPGRSSTYATFSKRGERGDHDLWGQHLKNLLDRLGKSAASLVDWEFFTIDGKDICRISIEPSDHPVYETKGDERRFWWRTPVSTERIDNDDERDRIIARRWAG